MRGVSTKGTRTPEKGGKGPNVPQRRRSANRNTKEYNTSYGEVRSSVENDKPPFAYTVVQDERYTYGQDSRYALGVQIYGIYQPEVKGILRFGGVVFEDPEEAEIFAFLLNWNDEKSIPWVHGRFPNKLIRGAVLYFPTNKERVNAGLPEFEGEQLTSNLSGLQNENWKRAHLEWKIKGDGFVARWMTNDERAKVS